MAYDATDQQQGGASKMEDAQEALRESVRQVRTNVLRTLVEELRQEVESMGLRRANGHGKADTHNKADVYMKVGTGAISL